jgi:hypothetical protein
MASATMKAMTIPFLPGRSFPTKIENAVRANKSKNVLNIVFSRI